MVLVIFMEEDIKTKQKREPKLPFLESTKIVLELVANTNHSNARDVSGAER